MENSSGDENDSPSKTSSSSKIKQRSTRRVNWTPSPEKETYRTVVVNYHYKVNKNRRSTVPVTPKKRDAWCRMMAAITAKRKAAQAEAADDDVPNLSNLYALKSEAEIQHLPTVPEDAEAKPDKEHENITVEIYDMPSKHEVELEEHERGLIKVSTTSPTDSKIILFSTDKIQNNIDSKKMNNNQLLAGETDTDTLQSCKLEHCKDTQTSNTTVITAIGSTASVRSKTIKEKRNARTKSGSNLPDVCSDTSQKLKVKTQTQNTFKQRQLELHRNRIAVEQKRLELLEVKLARERDEMLREQILFEKELELKNARLKELLSDKLNLN